MRAAPATAARRAWLSLAVLAVIGVALYVGLPEVAGLDDTWGRLSEGDPWWLAAALLFELGSYAAYVAFFRGVFARGRVAIGWRDSYDITMAGVAATRLLATAGLGGIALTGWALARAGMARRELTSGLTTFYVALYGVFMLSLVLVGSGLRAGVLPGRAPFGLTVVPAAFGGAVIVVALAVALLPDDLDERVRRLFPSRERTAEWAARLAAAGAAVAGGVRGALRMLARRDPALLGAAGWWACDIAVLWACFHAFGEPPPVAVVVMAYFTGMLGNVLPLPGGIGGVEGGMIAALIGFGTPSGLAVVAVLSYRAFAFWLPTVPGALAYLRLRHSVKEWSGVPRGEAP
ncbi:MAG TPA: YbhN family protein [Thermoleophilaceae bacterium]|nr:YbhN family protein [Thermoleophilaceae bacterium]